MLISFVIPVYNTDRFIGRCLDSILEQRFTDFEVIVIDDGSTDASGAILEEFARRDSRIKILRQPNSGQGAARNRGIDAANGDWIWFVDSDDWLTEEALIRVASLLRKYDANVFVANFLKTYEDGSMEPGSPPLPRVSGRVVSPLVDAEVFANLSCWNAPPWRLISRRSLLNERSIRFATGLFYEDHPFAIRLMLEAGKVYVDPSLSYAYFQRAGSTVNTSDRRAMNFIPIRRQSLDLLKAAPDAAMLSPVIAGYVSPYEFYTVHVAEPFRQEFVQALHKDTSGEEFGLARKYGHPRHRLFIDAIEKGEVAAVANPANRLVCAIQTLRERGPHHVMQHVRGEAKAKAVKTLRGLARRVRPLFDPAYAVRSNQGGRRYLHVGSRTITEALHIDVRLKPENRAYVVAGKNCIVSGYFVFERGVGSFTIGDNSSIGHGCQFICSQENGIHIGSHVMLSWDVTIIDTNAHSLDPDIRMMDAFAWKAGVETGHIGAYKDWGNVSSSPVVIHDKVWVGFGATIMKGVTIGRGAIVAAKSVVTKDVAPYTIVGGNPARFVGYVPREKWDWEDTIQAMQGDPSKSDLLHHAFLDGHPVGSFERYRVSEEFLATKKIVATIEKKSARMLDVGCGIGVTSIGFCLEGFEVDAVETAKSVYTGRAGLEAMIAFYGAYLPKDIHIHSHFLRDADLKPGYDFAICRQVVHHFTDPIADLRRIHDLLRPGGKALLLREHVIFDAADREKFLEQHPMQRFYGGEQAYTVDQYVSFSEKAGFVVEQVLRFTDSPINYFPHSKATAMEMGEGAVAGRPYSFVVRKAKAK